MKVLFSLRYSVARGWHYKHERNAEDAEVQDWLKVFREDEPEVRFFVANRMPTKINNSTHGYDVNLGLCDPCFSKRADAASLVK
jgi:hypothetical protein